jgi:hypothetical protein
MDEERFLQEIRLAEGGVADAETHLARLLAEVQAAPRAEKTTISEALHEAFEKLRESRRRLLSLEDLIRGEGASGKDGGEGASGKDGGEGASGKDD